MLKTPVLIHSAPLKFRKAEDLVTTLKKPTVGGGKKRSHNIHVIALYHTTYTYIVTYTYYTNSGSVTAYNNCLKQKRLLRTTWSAGLTWKVGPEAQVHCKRRGSPNRKPCKGPARGMSLSGNKSVTVGLFPH